MKKPIQNWVNALVNPAGIDEYDAKLLMKACGIRVPAGKKIKPAQQLSLSGIPSPYVLKVCDAGMIHKTDQKAVITGLDAEQAASAFAVLKKRFPDHAVLLEHHVHFDGPEIIIGVTRDPVFDLAVMVGAGGTLTEIYRDFSFRLIPCPKIEAEQMIRELAISKVFDNFRGMDLDTSALVDIIVKISQLAGILEDRLFLLDINPIVYASGHWTALDVNIAFKAD